MFLDQAVRSLEKAAEAAISYPGVTSVINASMKACEMLIDCVNAQQYGTGNPGVLPNLQYLN
jgi:hypothetical protein